MNTISKSWNGYSITNRPMNDLFRFDCAHCDFTMSQTFKTASELKGLREQWKTHVGTHGGAYA